MILELCGTFAEVYTADVLLQGRTNLDDYILSIKWCLGQCGCVASKADNKVHVQERQITKRTTFDRAIESQKSAAEKKSHQRTVFCATVMIINTITEASGLIVGSLFWICCNANPSTAGGGGIDMSQAFVNLIIMLFGELVLSDSVVAYISYKFSSRYITSIAHEWEGFRETQRPAIKGLIAIIALISSFVIMFIPTSLCLSSLMPNEEEWALTQCLPLWGVRNITNLLSVDDMYLTEWGDIT